MKKAEVKIGGKCFANVTNKRVEIQIDSEKASGGWNATNLETGKKIHIKSAQRLQGVVGDAKRLAKITTGDNVTVVENEPATVDTIGAVPTSVPKKASKKPVSDATAVAGAEKKLSCVTAAIKVLTESTEPLNAKEIIDAMVAKGYWTSPGGKTPHATLYSAILRDMAKGDSSRFIKSERGRFTART